MASLLPKEVCHSPTPLPVSTCVRVSAALRTRGPGNKVGPCVSFVDVILNFCIQSSSLYSLWHWRSKHVPLSVCCWETPLRLKELVWRGFLPPWCLPSPCAASSAIGPAVAVLIWICLIRNKLVHNRFGNFFFFKLLIQENGFLVCWQTP